jgi:hypothetical protein
VRGHRTIEQECRGGSCCIDAKGVPLHRPNQQSSLDKPLENRDKPCIRGLLRGSWAGRCGHLGWADR